jgi:hypothetical protein
VQGELQPSDCLLTIWPDKNSSESSGSSSGPTPGDVFVNIDRMSSHLWLWLPSETFAAIPLHAGVHEIERDPEQGAFGLHPVSFACKPGEYIFFAIGADRMGGDRPAIVLKSVDAAAAQSLIADVPQVLLP